MDIQNIIDEVRKTQKQWLSPDELFEEYGFSLSSQAKMRSKGTLPFSKLGSKYVRYNRNEIDKLLTDAKVV